MKAKNIICAGALALISTVALAQSKNFKLAQWTEIQNSILSELSRSYVDTLPVERMKAASIKYMLEELDPYTIYIPEEEEDDLEMMVSKSYGGIGAVIYKPEKDGNVIITEPYKNSAAEKYGLKAGDEILSIDGISVHGLTSSECSEKMRGKPGSTVVFKVKKLRQNDTISLNVVRGRIKLPDVEYYGMLDAETGYILQTGFTETASSEVRAAVSELKAKGMKKLFLDLRGNGGGLITEAVNIVSIFVPKGSVVVTSKGSREDSKMVYRTAQEPVDTQMPLVVLVSHSSASASEIVSGALQDLDRATIMGQRSYGKGLVQSIRPLPYNGKIKVTTAKYYTPSGRCVQAIDYAQRREDGSVSHIPDSLTHEFTTAHGRKVRDGGGITPDVTLTEKEYSRLTYSIVLNGIVEQYALKYVCEHEAEGTPDDFHYTDYADFVEFAKTKEFDYRSSAQALYDQMRKELEKDGLAETMKTELDAMKKAIEMDKETFLKLKKDEIIPFIEEEIAVRYWFQPAGVQMRIRYDDELKEAMTKPLITVQN